MIRHLFLPDFHTLCIAIFRVIDTKSVSKNPVKTFHNLHRKRNFWQEIKYLFMLIERLFDEVDIDLRLTAGSHSMQEHHILLHHLHQNLVVSILLGHRERFDQLKMRFARCIQTPYFYLVCKKKSLIYQTFDNGRGGMTLVHQFLLCYFFYKRRNIRRLVSI